MRVSLTLSLDIITTKVTDDEIFECLVSRVPEGVTLNIVLDTCHSGSAAGECMRCCGHYHHHYYS